MTGNVNIDKILQDKNYKVDHGNMHLTVDDLVVLKRQFDRQDETISELLKPLINDVKCLKEKVYVDHENRIQELERKAFKRRATIFGSAAVIAIAAILTIIL